MADVEVSFGAVDKGVQQAVRQLNQSLGAVPERHESKFKEAAGGIGAHILKAAGVMKLAHSTMHLLKESVREFIEQDDNATASVERMNKEWEKFKQLVGGDLWALIGDGLEGVVSNVIPVWQMLTDIAARLAGVSAEELSAQKEAKEEARKQREEWEKHVKLRERLLTLQTEIDEASGSELQAKLGKEDQRFRKQVEENRGLKLHGAEAENVDSMTRAVHEANVQRIITEYAEKQAEASREKARNDAEARRLGDESMRRVFEQQEADRRSLQAGEEEMKLDILRAKGKEREARLLELRYQTERKIYEIKQLQNITEEERQRAIERAQSQGDDLFAAEAMKKDKRQGPSSPVLGSGLYSATTAQQVFGPGGGGGASPELRVARDTNKKLDQAAKSLQDLVRSQRELIDLLKAG